MTMLGILNYYSNCIYTNIDQYNMCIVNVTAYIQNIPIQSIHTEGNNN